MTSEDALRDVAVVRPPESPALAALAEVDALAQVVEQLADDLRAVIPELVLRRGFADGDWLLGLHVGGLPGDRQAFSRLDLRIRRQEDDEQMRVEARHTVRDRRTVLEEVAHPAGSPELADWLRDQAQSFTARYFDRS